MPSSIICETDVGCVRGASHRHLRSARQNPMIPFQLTSKDARSDGARLCISLGMSISQRDSYLRWLASSLIVVLLLCWVNAMCLSRGDVHSRLSFVSRRD